MAKTKRVRRTKAEIEAAKLIENKGEKTLEKEVEQPINEVKENKPKTKGILLIALGHVQYGNMAYNLANSIRFSNPDLPIHLVHTDSSVSQFPDYRPFTTHEVCNPDYYKIGSQIVYIKAKTHMIDLSPFDETIFIDVDTLIFGGKDLNRLFKEYEFCDITFENYGLVNRQRPDKHFWCDMELAKKVYDFSHDAYEVCSQFVYFKKTDNVKEYFEVVKDIFINPKLEGMKFNGYLPDEMAFNIATGITGIKPHKSGYKILYWEYSDAKNDNAKTWSDIVKNYIGFSIGGNRLSKKSDATYHNIAKAQAQGRRWFRIYPKASWNKNRFKV